MVETIAPVVYGRPRDYRIAIALHVLAATAAAALFGGILGGIGLALGASWIAGVWIFVAIVGTLYAARELAGLPLPLFDRKQQVPDWWRTFYPPLVAALLYGAGLGIGFLTFLRHGTFVVVSTIAVTGGDPLLGALVTAPFGLARGLSVLAGSRARTEDDSSLLVARLEHVSQTRWPNLANGLACVALAALAAITGP